MNRRDSFHAGSNGMGSDTRKARGEMLSNGSGKVDREHLGGPLRGKMSVDIDARGVVGMRGIPNGIDMGEEMGRDWRGGCKLKRSEHGGVRGSVRGKGEVIIGPRGFGDEDDGRKG
jgi:hypothetical protein